MLKLKVVTPDKVITDEIVDSVSLPTTSGMITVLNKADIVRKEDLAWLIAQVPNPVIASAKIRFGLGSILSKIQEVISEVCPERKKYSA